MSFTIPNLGASGYAFQAEPDSADFTMLALGIGGNGVLTGCAVTQSSPPAMSVAVASGSVLIGGSSSSVIGSTLSIMPSDATLSRFDLITASNTGTLAVQMGTAAAHPSFPAIPTNVVVLASIFVPALVGTITTSQIVDKRITVVAAAGSQVPETRPTLFVAASNAPTAMKTYADYVCTGTGDQATIQAAISALPANGGVVWLSAGTFSVSAGITTTQYQHLKGSGVNATQIVSTTATFPIIKAGNRQSDGIMRNDMVISDMTVSHAGGASSNPCVWIDGGGQGTHIQNVVTNQGKYGFLLTDLDRCAFRNIRASNQRTAGIRCETGLENTYGTVAFYDCSVAISDNNGVGWQFDTNADQVSPNAFDRISIHNTLFFMTTGVTGGIGLQINNPGCNTISLYSCLFEQNITQVQLNKFTNIAFYDCTFLDANNACVDIFQMNNDNHAVAIYSCRLQQATNVFHGVSGFSNVAAYGFNQNDGNLGSILNGGLQQKSGTDTQFMGGLNLDLGSSGSPYSHVFMPQLDLRESGVANPVNGDNLQTFQLGVIRCQPASNVTGIRLSTGNDSGEHIVIRNESANTITFAASGTSNVANGTNCVIAANSCKVFSWSSSNNLWYPTM